MDNHREEPTSRPDHVQLQFGRRPSAEVQTMWEREHKRYLESGVWRCSLSPTGAHYWVGDEVSLTCKYCEKTTAAPVALPVWVVEVIAHKRHAAEVKRLLAEQYI